MILLVIFTKNAITQSKMVQISKFLCINPFTNICSSCGNIISIIMVINNELTGEETFKTFNFRPNFCIKNHILAHNSQVGPWSYLMSHIFVIHMSSGFRIGIALVWDRKFLLLGFLASVHHISSMFYGAQCIRGASGAFVCWVLMTSSCEGGTWTR